MPTWQSGFVLLAALSASTAFASNELATRADDGVTKIHETGRCSMRGNCGKQGFFGSELPCPDNGEAEKPDEVVREKLIAICGDKWTDSDVCCREEQ
ncbi:hypothetical protein LTS18_013050, partial [Coniosporium uncinatum]